MLIEYSNIIDAICGRVIIYSLILIFGTAWPHMKYKFQKDSRRAVANCINDISDIHTRLIQYLSVKNLLFLCLNSSVGVISKCKLAGAASTGHASLIHNITQQRDECE